MTQFSDYFESKIIDHMLRAVAYTVPATTYLALFTANTGLEANTGVTAEVTGGAYARMAFTLTTGAAGAADNTATITFVMATANWGTVSHVAIVDSLAGTTWGTVVNCLMWGTLTTAKTVNSGDTFVVATGDLDVTVT